MPELRGVHSQVRRLEQAPTMIRDAIALAFDVDPEAVQVDGPRPVLNPDLDELLRVTRARRAELVDLRATVDDLTCRLAHDMAAAGIPVRDIATVLDVSFQHAAKLASRSRSA